MCCIGQDDDIIKTYSLIKFFFFLKSGPMTIN